MFEKRLHGQVRMSRWISRCGHSFNICAAEREHMDIVLKIHFYYQSFENWYGEKWRAGFFKCKNAQIWTMYSFSSQIYGFAYLISFFFLGITSLCNQLICILNVLISWFCDAFSAVPFWDVQIFLITEQVRRVFRNNIGVNMAGTGWYVWIKQHTFNKCLRVCWIPDR